MRPDPIATDGADQTTTKISWLLPTSGAERIRAFFFLLALLYTAPVVMAESDFQVPTFDIDRNCSAEAGAGVNIQDTKANCEQDEADAKKQLDQRWSRLSADAKRQCVKEGAIGGDQSYVELITCLQILRLGDDRTVGEDSPKGMPSLTGTGSLPAIEALAVCGVLHLVGLPPGQ